MPNAHRIWTLNQVVGGHQAQERLLTTLFKDLKSVHQQVEKDN